MNNLNFIDKYIVRTIFLITFILMIGFSAQSQEKTMIYKYKALVGQAKPTNPMHVSKAPVDIANNRINPNIDLSSESIETSIKELKNIIKNEKNKALRKKYKKSLTTLKARKKYIKQL